MKKFITILLLFNLLTACQSTRESFSLKKKNDSDSFLVEKKNPLVMPPNYDDLPKPEDFELSEKEKNENEFKQVIKNTEISNPEVINKKTSLEKSVIDKIN